MTYIKPRPKRQRGLAISILTLLVAGCGGLSVPASAAPPVSDLTIQSEIEQRLAKSVIGRDGFRARVKDGVVYWEGSTTVAQHKGAATRMAKSAGARRVVNNIRVTTAKSGSKATAPKSEAVPKAFSSPPSAPPGAVPPGTPKAGATTSSVSPTAPPKPPAKPPPIAPAEPGPRPGTTSKPAADASADPAAAPKRLRVQWIPVRAK